MHASEITMQVPTVTMEVTVREAVRLLDREELYELPVIEGGKLGGIVSRKTLEQVMGNRPRSRESIEKYVIRDVVVVQESMELEDIPLSERCLTIPVVDARGHLLGVLEITRVYQHLLEREDPSLFKRQSLLPSLAEIESSQLLIEKVPLFQSILDSTYDGVLITDGKGVIIFVNGSYERISGYERRSVIGVHVSERFKKGLIYPSIVKEVLRKRQAVTMVQKYSAEGRYVLTTARPVLDTSESVIRVVSCMRDISDFVRLHHDLQVSRQLSRTYLIELQQLREHHPGLGRLVARSKPFQQVLSLASRVAQFDTTVLIMGESGVGKEMVARFIHEQSPRRDKPFVTINCAAIPPTLMESELFGYGKGSFTGANQGGKAGMFEVANNGTILMDEITEISLEAQAKLLRVLQEKEIQRIGERKPINVNVRVLAATNKDLVQEVRSGRFREDLYFRLNVVPLVVPPLRERKEDIPLLALQMLEQHNERYKRKKSFSRDALSALVSYSWPGNVRELNNVVEFLLVTTETDEIGYEDLPTSVQQEVGTPTAKAYEEGHLRSLRTTYESQLIQEALRRHRSLRQAARFLGVHASTLSRKLKKQRPLA